MAKTHRIQRILVGLDASQYGTAVQEAAAHLAGLLKAELQGLFVEDLNLIRLAQLPFTQEIPTLTGLLTPLHAEKMQQLMRRQATLLHYEFGQAASTRALDWQFQVVRGLVTQELLQAAQQADLLVLGRYSNRRALQKRIGSTALTAVQQASGSVLLVTPGMDLEKPVLLLVNSSQLAERAAQMAYALAQVSKQLHIILIADTDEQAAAVKGVIVATLNGEDVLRGYRRMGVHDLTYLERVLREIEPGLVVWGLAAEHNAELEVEQMLWQTADYPLLVVR